MRKTVAVCIRHLSGASLCARASAEHNFGVALSGAAQNFGVALSGAAHNFGVARSGAAHNFGVALSSLPRTVMRNVVIRSALWISVVLNLLGVSIFLPAAMGRESALLPIPGPPFYTAQVALVIGLFCGVYAWLARQRIINRPLLVVGALGKLGFFASAVIYWAAGDLPARVVPQSSPDLVLALVFLWWAFTEPKHA